MRQHTPARRRRFTAETPLALKRRARRMHKTLIGLYPEAHCELIHDGPFQLLVATVMSAQTTDVAVNACTPELFAAYPDAYALAAANPDDVERIIKRTGFYRAKTRSIMSLATQLIDRFDGEVPSRLNDLTTLTGVGRKTANVVLGNAFGVPGITVDTHFGRLARRFNWTTHDDPTKVEHDVAELFPKAEWTDLSHRMIFHGRRACHARRPACGACELAPECPSFGEGPTGPESHSLLKPHTAAQQAAARRAKAGAS